MKGTKVQTCMTANSRTMAARLVLLAALAPMALACTPTLRVEAPTEPITINLNVNLTADFRVRLEEQARQDIQSNPGIF
jgi:hypothetical protein